MNLYGYCGGLPVGVTDPSGLGPVEDFFAGWGDTLTFGATKWGRKWVGELLGYGDANESVDYDSGWYTAGEVTGTVHLGSMGAAGGWRLGAPGPGKEFSHTIPKRAFKGKSKICKIGRGRSRSNGNYVSKRFHALTDPFAHLTGGTKSIHPIVRYPLRLPFWLSGGAAGTGVGGASVALGQE